MDPDLRIDRKMAIGTPFEDWTSSMHYYDKAGWIYVVGTTKRENTWVPFLAIVDKELTEIVTSIFIPLTLQESKEKPLCGIYVDSPGIYMTIRPTYILKLNHYAEICDVAVITYSGRESVIWGFDARGSTLFTSHGTLLCKIQDFGESLKLRWVVKSKTPIFGRLRVYGNRVYSAQGMKDRASILVSSIYDEGSSSTVEWSSILHVQDEDCKSIEVGPNAVFASKDGVYVACGLCKDRRVLALKLTKEGELAWSTLIDFRRGRASIYGIHVADGRVYIVGKRDSDGILIVMNEGTGELVKVVAFPYSGLTDVTSQDRCLYIAGVTWNLSVVDDMFELSADARPVAIRQESYRLQLSQPASVSLKHINSLKRSNMSDKMSVRAWQSGDNDVLMLKVALN